MFMGLVPDSLLSIFLIHSSDMGITSKTIIYYPTSVALELS